MTSACESQVGLDRAKQTQPGVGGSRLLRGESKPELLAPAGDRSCLIAAVENGADAIYFGLERHNARDPRLELRGCSNYPKSWLCCIGAACVAT